MTWPHTSARFCCPACREPIPDVDTISVAEAERRQLAYVAERLRYRIANPHREREDK